MGVYRYTSLWFGINHWMKCTNYNISNLKQLKKNVLSKVG